MTDNDLLDMAFKGHRRIQMTAPEILRIPVFAGSAVVVVMHRCDRSSNRGAGPSSHWHRKAMRRLCSPSG